MTETSSPVLTTRPFRFSPDDVRTASEAAPSLRLTMTKLVWGAAAMAAVIGLGAGAALARMVDFGVPGGPLGGWAAFAVVVALQLWMARAHTAAMTRALPENQPEQTVILDAVGVRQISATGETLTRWTGISRLDRRGDDLVLTATNGLFHVIPARAVPDAAWRETAVRFIEERLAQRAV